MPDKPDPNDFLAALIDSTDDAVLARDLSGRVMAWNRGAVRLFGYTLNEMQALPIEHFEPPDCVGEASSLITRALNGEVIQDFRTIRIHKDGRKVHVNLTVSPIRNRAGQLMGVAVMARDVSGHVHMEEELAVTAAALRQKASELEAQNESLRRAHRLKSEFLANMSHELRTPLNSIIGFSELIMDEEMGPLPNNYQECIRYVHRSGRHLLRLIDDVLAIGRVEAGFVDIRPQKLNLASVIHEEASVLRDEVERKRLSLVIDVAPELQQVILDFDKVRQIVRHLLTNAIKFTDAGRIAVRARLVKNHLFELEVEDCGPGIREEDRPRLFRIFEQLDMSLSKKYPGTGLGLALCKRYAEVLGGSIRIDPSYHAGARFVVALPRVVSENVIRTAQPSLPPNCTHLLVVRDQKDVLDELTKKLRHFGYDVDAVESGRAALQRCQETRFMAIILPLLLKDMKGTDLLTDIQDTLNQSVPVIIVSTARHVVPTLYSVHDVLLNPFRLDDVLTSLNRLEDVGTLGTPNGTIGERKAEP